MKLSSGEFLRAEVLLVDGDYSGPDRHFVMFYLNGERVAESREMTLPECEALRDRINGETPRL